MIQVISKFLILTLTLLTFGVSPTVAEDIKDTKIQQLETLLETYIEENRELKEINFSMDDYSHENLEKIKKMGMFWWSEFGDRAIKFLDSN